MLPNAFIGKPEQPTDDELTAELGRPARALWDQLLADLAREQQVDFREWKSYSRKAGWALCLRRGKRAIVYLSPSRGGFMASFALGGKAIEAARKSGLPVRVITIIDEARHYAEGTAVRIDVKGAGDIGVVEKLASAKIEN